MLFSYEVIEKRELTFGALISHCERLDCYENFLLNNSLNIESIKVFVQIFYILIMARKVG